MRFQRFATSVSGVIDGSGALVKSGGGVALSGANTYAGNTTTSRAGGIKICNRSATSSGRAATWRNEGTLDVNGYRTR